MEYNPMIKLFLVMIIKQLKSKVDLIIGTFLVQNVGTKVFINGLYM